MKRTAMALLLALSGAAPAQEDPCAKVLCREPLRAEVNLKDGAIIEMVIEERTPIVMPNGVLTIYPGEEVHIALDSSGGGLVPRAVKDERDPARALTYRFRPDRVNASTMLVVSSATGRAIKYDLGIRTPEDERYLKTSSCPVRPGQSVYESWPHPVIQFVAARYRFLEEGASMACE